MEILFIQKDAVEHYGLMIISAILKKHGINTDILVNALETNIEKKIKETNANAIAITALSSQHTWVKKIVKTIKKNKKIPIILGGPHATFYPSIMSELNIDYLIRGEAEIAIIPLIGSLNSRRTKKIITKIPNTWVKIGKKIIKNDIQSAIENLDSIPFADRYLYKKYPFIYKSPMATLFASRGCPYNCTFCFNKKFNELYKGKNKIFRIRSVENVIKELKHILSLKKPKSIVFDDDTFLLLSPKWIKEFTQEYKKITNIPFSVNARANVITKEKIKMLKDANCNLIRMGIESFDEQMREKILKKGISNKQIINAGKIMKKNNIMIQYYFILGIPGETIKTALRTYDLAKQMHPTQAWCSLLNPYPGTEIAEIAYNEGFIKKKYNNLQLNNSFFDTLPLDIPNKKEIIRLQKLFQLGNLLRINKNIMKILIKLPLTSIYSIVFQMTYGLAVKKLYNFPMTYMVKIAWHSIKFYKN